MDSTPPQDSARPGRGVVRLGLDIYRQVAAVMGAIAIAAMLASLFKFEWRSILRTAVEYWSEYVRPTVAWLLDTVVATPLEWMLGWQITVPLFLRDYLAVALVSVTLID